MAENPKIKCVKCKAVAHVRVRCGGTSAYLCSTCESKWLDLRDERVKKAFEEFLKK